MDLCKPEYLFRPAQVGRRLLRGRGGGREGAFAEAVLPWGLPIRFRPADTIGAGIWRAGVYDLCVCEALWRLLDPGETALDVGANIGQMTSAMAARVGPSGTVLAFEPHPEVWEELTENIARWRAHPGVSRVISHRLALSDRTGTATLGISAEFGQNRGTASLVSSNGETVCRRYEVPTKRLEELKELIQEHGESGTSVGVMKIDVEGHELAVLRGGKELLRRRRIRDIVFEEHDDYPTPVTQFLEAQGYAIFRIGKGFFGPRVCPAQGPPVHGPHDAPSYLATTAPDRALKRLRKKGWTVLRGGSCLASS